VLSRDPTTGAQGYQRVSEVVVTHPAELYRVHYRLVRASQRSELPLVESRRTFGADGKRTASSDDDPDEHVVRSTGNHPFYVVDRADFVEAALLAPGDRMRLASGEEAVVVDVALDETAGAAPLTTFNLVVEGFHTYFVGDGGLWVHNSGPFTCKTFARWFTTAARDLAKKVPNLPDWDVFMITFQRADSANKQYTWQAARDRLLEFMKLFPGARPRSWKYSEWKGPAINPRHQLLKDEKLQGHHWWPVKELGIGPKVGGAEDEGAVIPLSSPFLHTRGTGKTKSGYGVHPVMWDFLRAELKLPPDTSREEIMRIWAKGRKGGQALKDPALFEWQKGLLKKFYQENYGLDMPDFLADPKRPDYGRGVWRPGM
jgi:hypothetical protein